MIRLFYNYYEDKHPDRKKEIDFCLQQNLNNPHLNTIIFETPSKPTYNTFFHKINEITGPDDINIICNSDIFFDDSISLVSTIETRSVYVLCRWDWHSADHVVFANRPDSQDTWIIKGKVENVFGDFCLGVLGCDNRIAYEFNKAGYRVSNPSKSIKTYHVHNSGIRNYTKKDVVPPPYLTLHPRSL